MLRISDHKNVNKRKNRLTPLKLESKKHDKKVLASKNVSKNPLTPAKLKSKKQDKKIIGLREGSGWGVSSERPGTATSVDLPPPTHRHSTKQRINCVVKILCSCMVLYSVILIWIYKWAIVSSTQIWFICPTNKKSRFI